MAASNSVTTPQQPKVGFIGIGNMGDPMAAHLIRSGWNVKVYDVDVAKAKAFAAAHGGGVATNLENLGSDSNVIITMLPDGHIVRRVLLGEAGGDCIVKGLRKGSVVIDMSSSAPVGTRELGNTLNAHGISLLDAPVSGGVRGAVAGTLAIMVGGDAAVARAVDLLLAPMGKRFYAGTLGAGHAIKVLNNYVSAAGLAAAGEAMIIGERFGIDPATIIGIINASTGRNNSTENKFAQFILNKKYNAGFALGLMAKDITLAMEVADAVKVPAGLGRATLDIWKAAEKSLGGHADHTEIVKYLEDLK